MVQNFKEEIIYLLILTNFISYFVYFDFLKIQHRFQDKCKPIQGISANFSLHVKNGHLIKYLDSSKFNLICRTEDMPKKYRKNFSQQLKLKSK